MMASREDVRDLVAALFTLTAGLERARRDRRQAAALDLLQVIAGSGGDRPSDIATLRGVHPSQVTRQLGDLEQAGYVALTRDSLDRRSWRVTLTGEGAAEMARLQEIGLDRFCLFLSGWTGEDVQSLAAQLRRLKASIDAADPGPSDRPSRRSRRSVRHE
jgi:DNA-binding MarR family transcriptional regulator